MSFGNNPSALVHVFPRYIWDDPTLSLYEASVLCRVATFENSNPPLQCYLSFEQWATELRCTRRHAINVLNGLIEKNRLRKESRGLQTNIWRLVNTVHYQEGTSEYSSLPLVNTVHYPSEYSSLVLVNTVHPRRSLEDQKEDHKEDHIPESLLSQDDPGTPLKKNEALKLDPVFKDSLTTEEPFLEKPPLNEVPIPLKKSRRLKEPMTLCPAPSVWLTQERMDRLKGVAREVPSWGSLSDSDLETAIKNLSYRMHTWSEGKKKQRAGWELTFKKWLPGNNPELQERGLSDSMKRDNARDLFSRLVEVASELSRFRSAFEKVPILARLYDSDEAIGNYRDQLKPLKKGTKDYEITEAVFVKRFLDKASQCQR